jgi:hypothetical protein
MNGDPIAADVLLEAWEHATEDSDDLKGLCRNDSSVANRQPRYDDLG